MLIVLIGNFTTFLTFITEIFIYPPSTALQYPPSTTLQMPPDTYWDGAGDTPGMSYYEQAGGYLRFTDYPIRVYLFSADETWRAVLDDALSQLGETMPIIRADRASHADIFINLLADDRFARLTDCLHTDACSRMIPVGTPGTDAFTLTSRIWIRRETRLPPLHVLLHELLHALGLLVHSPYPDDVLYNGADSTPVMLSARDRATLIYLYTQPAVGE